MSSFKKISFLLLLFLNSFLVAGQDQDKDLNRDSTVSISYDKKREKTASLLFYKYQSGEYDEMISLSEKYVKRLKKKNLAQPSEYVQQYLGQANSNYALLHFSQATVLLETAIKTYEENKSRASAKENLLMPLWIAQYYYETGRYTDAEIFCNKADSVAKTNVSNFLSNDVRLLKSKILFRQEYYDEALALAEKLYDEATFGSFRDQSVEGRFYIKSRLDSKARLDRAAEAGNLKASILVKKELYTEAEQAITNQKEWIQKNTSKNSTYYRDLLQLEAYKESYNNHPLRAALLYQSAYTTYESNEDETNKINNLSEGIIEFLKSNDLIRSQNYLRRLQMYAFQHVGKTERYQIAYDYTMAMKLYLEGQLEASSSRLEGLKKILEEVKMPAHHSYIQKVKELESLIARKSNNVQALNKTELEIAALKGTYYGLNTPSYHKTLLNIAIEEIRYGSRFKFAEETFVKSYDGFLKKKISKNSKENSYYLTAYAELFLKTDRYDSARVKSKQVAKINQELYGESSADYVLALANYSEYCVMSGQYKEGLDSLKKVVVLSDMKTGDIETRQKTLLSIARLNKLFGEYDKSQSLTNKAFKLNKKSNYDQDILLQSETAEQLADLFIQTGNYSQAEKTLKKSLASISAVLGDYSPRLIPIYFGYTRFNLITGNYNQSDGYLTKANKVIDSVFGGGSLIKAESYLLSGDYFMMISDFKRAEDAYLKADNIQRLKLGKKHLKRAETILRLASLYGKQEGSKAADFDKLYKEALDIVKTDIGTANPLYAETEQRYAEFLIATNAYDQADKLLEEADKFWISKLGNENRYTAEINLLRGNIAYAKSKYEEAEKKYGKAKTMYASLFDDKHPDYIESVGKLARVYYMKNQQDKALEAMDEIIPKYLRFSRETFPSLSFRQKTKFWNNLKEEFEFYASIALQQPKGANLKYTGKVYNNVLSTKALLLSSNIKLLDKILHSNDSILIALYNEWVSEKEYQISMLSFSKKQLQEQGIDLEQIQSNVERLEKEMSQRSELFFKDKLSYRVMWEDVRSKLQPNEYAIEIIRFRQFNKVFTDSVIYAALIIDPTTKDNPDLVLLPNGKQMEKRYLKYYRNTATLNAPDEFSYDVYWQPIKNKIPDGALVYLSCDKVYNEINLEMLPKKGTETYVIDQNQIVLLTNTKDLLMMESVNVNSKKKTKDSKKSVNTNAYVFCGSPLFYTNSKISKKNIPDLPGAEKEIVGLNNLLVSADKSTLLLTQTNVTEDTIKSLRSPKVLHIATHGYFKESTKGVNEDDIASSSMLNSGLMLLGSGDIVDNPDNKYVNQKQGILTAYEAMDLPLENTDIVVLSACETGRGETEVGEGVYGLQRAFLIAGARSIVISLFKVNDEVTQQLMLSFYQKWLKTGDKRLAFSEAKKEIKQQYKNPLYWGAFLMIEGKPERFSSQP